MADLFILATNILDTTKLDPNHYGTRVVAMVAVLSGLYRHSQRTVKTAMTEIFDIRLSLLINQ